MKNRLFSVSLVLMLLILVSTVASAGQYVKIGSGSEPVIDADKIVWVDNGTIRVYDLTIKEETAVRSSAASHPAISGDKLVWHDEGGLANMDSGDLYVYYLVAGKSKKLTSGNTVQTPVISGNIIVWSDSGSIYMLNY